MSATMSVQSLGAWSRMGLIAVGSTVVLFSALVVVCIVGPGCWLNTFIFGDAEEREKRRQKSQEKERLFGPEPPLIYYKTADTPVLDNYTLDDEKNGVCSPTRRLSPPFATPHQQTVNEKSLLGALSTKRDSTYSSMSENSGKTSPTNSCRSSVEGSFCSGGLSNMGSPTGGDAQGQLSFAVQFVLTNEERGVGKLIVTVMEAHGLPGRQYMGGACDPYVKVVVWRERRSIRKLKSLPLHEYRTRTVRHTTDPAFNESFVMEVSKNEVKELMLKVTAMDSDKWVSPTTLGEVVQPLRDIKTLVSNAEKTKLNFFLAPAKLDFGEVLFGLSYLPTAQRLSVSIMKATNLKFTNVVQDITEFCPYVRVLLLSASGKVLRKKKTSFRSNTDKPVWNETLIFDMPHNLVETVTFILVVCSRPQPTTTDTSDSTADMTPADTLHPTTNLKSPLVPKRNSTGNGNRNDNGNGNSNRSSQLHRQSYRKHDKYVGKVVLGCHVAGEEEKRHWMGVLSAPRKVTSHAHTLK